jgi:hypothetical protein
MGRDSRSFRNLTISDNWNGQNLNYANQLKDGFLSPKASATLAHHQVARYDPIKVAS